MVKQTHPKNLDFQKNKNILNFELYRILYLNQINFKTRRVHVFSFVQIDYYKKLFKSKP